MRLKQSRLAAMMFKILYRQKKMLLSVVQTSVEVTESSPPGQVVCTSVARDRFN